ncbi:MAG: TIGR04348 family glycosyltransferase [Pseudonocardiaceae bacterium]|nr:TIGR04348 family glycosyltransferase [Pseudonocardiaceae bacterium]
MRIEIVTPAPVGSHHGNRVTADRWAGMLTELGHEPTITTTWSGEPVDALIALHAHRSSGPAREFAAAHPDRPLIIALTGTDLYRDLAGSVQAQQAIEAADALVVLQARAVDAVPARLRDRVHVIHQSVAAPGTPNTATAGDTFEVVVLAHLRAVKDPFLAAVATRLLPADSAVRVTHCGAPIDPGTAERARAESAANSRYRWLGDVPRRDALRHLAASSLLVLTSRLEGGANAVSEALAAGVPVLSTRVEGSVGLLGDDYPGYVAVGDAAGLAQALQWAERDPTFLAALTAGVAARRELVDPERERQAWADLIARVVAREL